jgi:DNA-binding NarL/FixJ family response regulator
MGVNTPLQGLKVTAISGEKITRIKTLLANVHNMVSHGLRRLLEQEKDLELIGEADNGAGIVRLARELKPDIIVMEAHLPGMDPANVVRQVKNCESHRTILILTTPDDNDSVIELFLAGAVAGTDFSKSFRKDNLTPCHGGDRGFKSPRGRQLLCLVILLY